MADIPLLSIVNGVPTSGTGEVATLIPLRDTLGAIADAAATAGSTGSLSAKLRLMTTQLANLDVVNSLRATTNGLTSTRVSAAASTNATSVKGSAGRIAQLDLFNNAASTKYFKLYNKASAPTVGSDTPVWTIPLPAGGGYSGTFDFGKYFATGIAYAITGALADSDTTAVTALDVTGSIDWI